MINDKKVKWKHIRTGEIIRLPYGVVPLQGHLYKEFEEKKKHSGGEKNG